MQFVGMLARMPGERLGEGLGIYRRTGTAYDGIVVHRTRGIDGGLAPCRGVDLAQQVAQGLDLGQGTFGQGRAEFAFGAMQQFHAGQAVEAVIALEMGIERKGGFRRFPRIAAQFARHRLREGQQAGFTILAMSLVGKVHPGMIV